MFFPQLRFVLLRLVVVGLLGASPGLADSTQQARMHVNTAHCQTDLEQTICTLAARLDALRAQAPYWDGPFETDPTCDAVLLVLAHKLGKVSPELWHDTVERIVTWPGRTTDGWAAYPGGPYDHNTTAIILLSLQAVGLGRDHAEFAAAWQAFDSRGSVDKLTVTSRVFLDALGLHRHQATSFLSPKIVALSKVLPVNIFKLGILRSVIVPQIGLKYYALLPQAQPIDKAVLKERGHLFGRGAASGHADLSPRLPHGGQEPDPAYYLSPEFLDALVLHSEEFWAQEILAWTLKLQQADGTWYALASTINSVLLLKEAQDKGVADFTAEIDAAWHGLMQLRRPSHQGPRFVQTILSTIWDTANALSALLNVDKYLLTPPADAWQPTVEWLLRHQFPAREMLNGAPTIVPKAWSFSHLDREYLDADDTAAVLNALLDAYRLQPSAPIASAMASAVAWLLQLQNEDGGFPSWNRGMNKALLQLMGPNFKDLMDVVDVSQTDVTARNLYVLTRLHEAKIVPASEAALTTSIANACAFVKRSATLLADHHTPVWLGDWAVNYVYGTAFATLGLLHARCWTPSEAVASVQWLLHTQQPSGGWGESPASYQRAAYVPAPPTLFQTTAALLALIEYYEKEQETAAMRHTVHRAIEKGIAYLIHATRLGHHTQEDTYTAVAVKGQMFVQYYYVPYYFTLYTLTRWHTLQRKPPEN